MSIGKLPCGCEIGLDRHGRETYTTQCIQHKKEFDMRHAMAAEDAAAKRAQFINLDLVS